MTSFSSAAKHLFLLTVLGWANSSSPSLVTAETAGWRNELDWDDLASMLSPSASLINTSLQNYKDECAPEFFTSPATQHALIDQPSGMCLNHYFWGWEKSWARPSETGHMNQTFAQNVEDIILNGEMMLGFTDDDTNPSLDLPSKVVFPAVASDVVKIIQFAKKNSLEISVKNSGHSYSGSSSKKDTLLMNMNRYIHYAPDGIMDCDAALVDTVVADDLSNQACLLALARNKPGLIRIGGGENFDKVYRAVIAANKALEEYKYHIVGGAAGTVSPMGWTWQGGNAGTTGGRLYGMGVDQVLQVEMVLPNGYHVKFGPTEWENASADGFVFPRTKVVSGVCRGNPDEEDEEEWIWGDCPEDFDIDFGDLWLAVKGGGGGTWGVVTSVSLQLHDYLPFKQFVFGTLAGIEECSAFGPKFEEFRAKYLMTPALLNVTKERSVACSAPDFPALLYCFGEEDVVDAWTNFLQLNNVADPRASSCVILISDGRKSDAEGLLMNQAQAPGNRFPEKIPDGIPPFFLGAQFGKVLVPQSWIDESEENIDILLKTAVRPMYFAYGVATAGFSDQADSLSQAHRDAAVMVELFDNDDTDFWSNLFPKMFDISDKTKFPPVFGSNHAGPLLTGPLKEDWTKPCPREWTFEERSKNCISSQEAIYGTDLLDRLETIKMAVDPNFMFNCHSCIGNNIDQAKVADSQDDNSSSPPPDNTSDLASSATYAFTFTAATFATVFQLYLVVQN